MEEAKTCDEEGTAAALEGLKVVLRDAWALCGITVDTCGRTLFDMLKTAQRHVNVVIKLEKKVLGTKRGVRTHRKGKRGNFTAAGITASRILRWKVPLPQPWPCCHRLMLWNCR